MTEPGGDGNVMVTREVDPFELGVLLVSLAYGLICLAAFEKFAATSIKLYPFYTGRVFVALLVVGSMAALLGVAMRSLLGLRLELAGLTLLCALGASYTLWTPFTVGARGMGLVLFLGMVITFPSFVVARRRRKQVEALEALLDGARPQEGNE